MLGVMPETTLDGTGALLMDWLLVIVRGDDLSTASEMNFDGVGFLAGAFIVRPLRSPKAVFAA